MQQRGARAGHRGGRGGGGGARGRDGRTGHRSKGTPRSHWIAVGGNSEGGAPRFKARSSAAENQQEPNQNSSPAAPAAPAVTAAHAVFASPAAPAAPAVSAAPISEATGPKQPQGDWLGRNVYVRNLPPVHPFSNIMPSETHVHNLFSQFGEIESMRVVRDCMTNCPVGIALVLFKEPEAAQRAILAINASGIGAVASMWLPKAILLGTEEGIGGENNGPLYGSYAAAAEAADAETPKPEAPSEP